MLTLRCLRILGHIVRRAPPVTSANELEALLREFLPSRPHCAEKNGIRSAVTSSAVDGICVVFDWRRNSADEIRVRRMRSKIEKI